uniref:Uncharacterized protein n=1 Tax=Romanomermis culicivorax TaxID=13658 RepID=A0A915IEE4_ROMCU
MENPTFFKIDGFDVAILDFFVVVDVPKFQLLTLSADRASAEGGERSKLFPVLAEYSAIVGPLSVDVLDEG